MLLVALTGCAAGPRPAGGVVDSGERYVVAARALDEYKLGDGDKVRMTVFNEPTLSGEFAVSANGTLSLPLIGDVTAIGRSPGEVARDVQSKLAEGYLKEPRISMEVASYRPFFILGEVGAPGEYPYRNGLTAMNAIATAKGFTARAAKGIVYIRSAGAASEVAYRLTPDLQIWPGDTIRLGERFF